MKFKQSNYCTIILHIKWIMISLIFFKGYFHLRMKLTEVSDNPNDGNISQIKSDNDKPLLFHSNRCIDQILHKKWSEPLEVEAE